MPPIQRTAALFLPLWAAACGSKVDVTFRIANLASPDVPGALLPEAQVAASRTPFAYAHVDGIKLRLESVRGAGRDDQVLTWVELQRDLELGGGASQTAALTEVTGWAPGEYRGVTLILPNTWQVKGYCKTSVKSEDQYTLIYSTAAGFKAKACPGPEGRCTELPADYDYAPRSFMLPDIETTDLEAAARELMYLETHTAFDIGAADTPVLTLLYDGTYNVTCWDGTSWEGGFGFPGATPEVRPSYYPDGMPVIGGSYPPLFAILSQDPAAPDPAGRTFAVTYESNPARVDPGDPSFDFARVNIATFVYATDGTPLAAGARNLQAWQVGNVIQPNLEGFAPSAGAGWDFYSSEWYWGETEQPGFVRNWRVRGFHPPDSGTTFATEVDRGPECGREFLDGRGENLSRPCLPEFSELPLPRDIYWRELNR